ncbi:MAG: hypothetical protein ABSH20_22780 [Tepidisphaeraceae bacterium]|jgi:hypothetical protein
MYSKWLLIALVSLGLAATSAHAKSDKGDKEDKEKTEQRVDKSEKKETSAKKDVKKSEAKADEEDEETVSIKQVPPRVRKTLKREAGDATIETVDIEEDNGKTIYEADVEIDGLNYEIKVDAKGRLISKIMDAEDDAPKGRAEVKSDKKVERKADKTGRGEISAQTEKKADKSEKNEKAGKTEKKQDEEKAGKKQKKDKEDDDDK